MLKTKLRLCILVQQSLIDCSSIIGICTPLHLLRMSKVTAAAWPSHSTDATEGRSLLASSCTDEVCFQIPSVIFPLAYPGIHVMVWG